ncbi:MAG: hypothetical protein P0S95_02315 [Rhabdochlamydiaceae bacterium]|nr:hypothetical protein [Candidatus Amphrikana amoebophyrae]
MYDIYDSASVKSVDSTASIDEVKLPTNKRNELIRKIVLSVLAIVAVISITALTGGASLGVFGLAALSLHGMGLVGALSGSSLALITGVALLSLNIHRGRKSLQELQWLKEHSDVNGKPNQELSANDLDKFCKYFLKHAVVTSNDGNKAVSKLEKLVSLLSYNQKRLLSDKYISVDPSLEHDFLSDFSTQDLLESKEQLKPYQLELFDNLFLA